MLLYGCSNEGDKILFLGSDHLGRINPFLVLFLSNQLEGQGRFLEGDAFLVSLLCNLGGVVVADLAVQGSYKHKTLVHDLLDGFLVGLDTNNAVLGERLGGIRQKADRLEQVLDQDGLEDVQLEGDELLC